MGFIAGLLQLVEELPAQRGCLCLIRLIVREIVDAVGILRQIEEFDLRALSEGHPPEAVSLAEFVDQRFRRTAVGVLEAEFGVAARPAFRGEVVDIEEIALADRAHGIAKA